MKRKKSFLRKMIHFRLLSAGMSQGTNMNIFPKTDELIGFSCILLHEHVDRCLVLNVQYSKNKYIYMEAPFILVGIECISNKIKEVKSTQVHLRHFRK